MHTEKPQNLTALIEGSKKLMGYTNEVLAVYMHMCAVTLGRKIKNPDKFTYKELRRLEEILHIRIFDEGVAA